LSTQDARRDLPAVGGAQRGGVDDRAAVPATSRTCARSGRASLSTSGQAGSTSTARRRGRSGRRPADSTWRYSRCFQPTKRSSPSAEDAPPGFGSWARRSAR
jgi:hypothetical protein